MHRLLVGILFCLPISATAQINFDWETRRQDTLYHTVEDCLGLMRQVQGRTEDWDTTAGPLRPPQELVARNTVHDTVVMVAQQCSRKFSVDGILALASSDPALVVNAVELLIKAKRDTDALALIERWTAGRSDNEDTLKNFVRFQSALIALKDQPTRFATIRQIANSIAFTKFWGNKIEIYGEVMERAIRVRDTAELDAAVAWLVAIPGQVDDSIKKLERWRGGNAGPMGLRKQGASGYIYNALVYSQRVALLNKLRESTTNYLEFLAVLRKEVGGGERDPRSDELAKPIIAERWFPETPDAARPTRGKVAVVYPRNGNECNPCWYDQGLWGRIAKKFPEVEFTLLTRTHGNYGRYFGMLSADAESRLIDSFHRKVYGFPGMVAVHETKFWRLDEPYDRRVIEEPGPNEDQYPMFGSISSARIIDRNGRFIPYSRLSLDPEESMMLLFEALVNQPAS